MAKRNLQKWAEAKQRRAAQHPPLRGRWIYLADGTGIFLEDPDPLFGTCCAPTSWLPMEPAPAIGNLLQHMLDPVFPEGAPYTHTFNYPPTEYDEDGEPLPPRIEPTMTITRIAQEEASPAVIGLHPLLLDHSIDAGLR